MTRGKKRGIAKGAPSGFLISLLVHAAAFLLAGVFVVFTVIQKEEPKFVAPKPIDRPKMKLKKPKVQLKKNTKPKSANRIVTKVRRSTMPSIQLPEMSGMGEALTAGIGGLELMPDLSDITIFGASQTIGNDFEGTFYDFKRNRSGNNIAMDEGTFGDRVSEFTRSGWNPSKLAQYYRAPKKLYATCFMVPTVPSSIGPFAFGETTTVGWCWLAHYKGKLVHKEDITFRFWGEGDDILVVRVDGKVVLNASWPGGKWDTQNRLSPMWQSSANGRRNFRMGNNYAEIGDWITLKAGEPHDMEVILGEVPGGNFDAMLCVEVEGVEYERNRQGGPILPMFKTEEPSHELLDAIIPILIPGEACLTNGPVFRDY